MFLSRPTFAVWLLSTILAALVIALKYFGVSVPVLTDIVAGNHFEVLLVAFVLLWAGTVFKGI